MATAASQYPRETLATKRTDLRRTRPVVPSPSALKNTQAEVFVCCSTLHGSGSRLLNIIIYNYIYIYILDIHIYIYIYIYILYYIYMIKILCMYVCIYIQVYIYPTVELCNLSIANKNMGIFGIFTYQHIYQPQIGCGFSARDALAMLVQRASLIVGSTAWMLVKH